MSQKMSWNTTMSSPPHVPLGGHRRDPHLHALPALRHVQRADLGEELARSARNFKDAGPANRSLMASATATEVAARPGDDGARSPRGEPRGSPKVVVERPRDFFAKAEAEYEQAPVWSARCTSSSTAARTRRT